MASTDGRTSSRPEHRRTVLTVAPPLCRRCVRLVSRCLRDVAGVTSWQVDPVSGQMTVHGDVDPGTLVRVLNAAGWRVA